MGILQRLGRGRRLQDRTPGQPGAPGRVTYRMRLFVAGDEPNSRRARQNLRQVCAEELSGDFDLEVIDVYEAFEAVIEEHILLVPVLIVDEPSQTRVYGNLDDREKVLAALRVAPDGAGD